jgi:ribosomal protein L7/L12
MAQLPEQQRQAIEAAIFAGNKIEAIKLYRKASGAGLAKAKQAVEAMETELRAQHPEKFTAARKSGCVGVVALVALAFSVTVLAAKLVRLF